MSESCVYSTLIDVTVLKTLLSDVYTSLPFLVLKCFTCYLLVGYEPKNTHKVHIIGNVHLISM